MKGSLKVKIIEPFVELINAPDYKTLLTTIEAAGRTCYKSEDKITDGSAEKFVRGIIKRGHEAVIEHGSLTVRFICDRGVSHEIVRHRLAAFCQESTRYCNYGKEGFGGEITVIRPSTFAKTDSTYHIWKRSCEHAEVAYFDLLNEGCTPQEARSILPNSLKTEVVMTADLREWRHFCRMRCPVAAHPDMRVVANMLLTLLKQTYPVFFEDIEV
jgi:thymidylate synthase (FAD)